MECMLVGKTTVSEYAMFELYLMFDVIVLLV